MNKTQWKSIEEIEYITGPYKKLTLLSCSLCANLSGTGGDLGITVMDDLLSGYGKKVVASGCVLACCEENIMQQAMIRYGRAISNSDALMVLSCAAGVKAAFLCEPDIPVISPLDPVGSVAVTQQRSPVADSVCTMCGSCVINYTGGICPVYACPAKSKYRPCINAPETGEKCVVNTDRICIWQEIKRQGNMEGLRKLDELQRGMTRRIPYTAKGITGFTSDRDKPGLPQVRRCLGWLGARSRLLAKVIAVYRLREP